jgi:hypothetical protein
MSAKKLFTVLVMLFDWSIALNDGAAIVARIATIAITTINSTIVNPRDLFICG